MRYTRRSAVADPLGVDTDPLLGGTLATGVEGIDSDVSPALSGASMAAPSLTPVSQGGSADSGPSTATPTSGGDGSRLIPATGTATGSRADVIKYAEQWLGTPYVWGGTNLKSGVDCSGFTQAVLRKFGVNLPRISNQQANAGAHVGMGEAQPGDLVAWDENARNNGADHIAIYAGNGMIIEAPHTGATVRIRKLGKNEGEWFVRMAL